jgi:hypothetical protein
MRFDILLTKSLLQVCNERFLLRHFSPAFVTRRRSRDRSESITSPSFCRVLRRAWRRTVGVSSRRSTLHAHSYHPYFRRLRVVWGDTRTASTIVGKTASRIRVPTFRGRSFDLTKKWLSKRSGGDLSRSHIIVEPHFRGGDTRYCRMHVLRQG